MTIASIIIKNIKGNLNKYIMYFLSNVIVVTIFFLFADFAYNPAVDSITNQGSLGSFIAQIMGLCEFVIVIFTVIFAGYSISNFLKSREKEFGLLSMFGLTKSQIRRYVIVENIIISSVSIITGLFFGILFSKLFYMAVNSILNLEAQIEFVISYKAVIITAASFFIVLNLISFIMSLKIKNSNIANLLKGARIPKENPEFSKAKALLAIVLIIGSYVAAINSKLYIVFTMIPIFIAVVIGTKMLFTQFCVYFTDKLQKSRHIYYKGINMITLSQIIYKLKDNAKVMFITSILSGVTLATAVSVYSLEQVSLNGIEMNSPNDIAVMENGVNSHAVISEDKVTKILNDNDIEITDKDKVNLIKVKNNDNIENQNKKSAYKPKVNINEFYIISLKDHNSIAEKNNKKKFNLNDNESVLYTYDTSLNLLNIENVDMKDKIDSINVDNNGTVDSLKIVGSEKGGILNETKEFVNTLVVNDNEFNKMYKSSSEESKYVYYGYNIKESKQAVNAANEIRSCISEDNSGFFDESISKISSIKEILSIILFIGTFIAMIFFIATGSILYFKMFNEIQKDRYDFMGLKKIGVTKGEINKTISVQSFIMFFLPLTVASVHAVFAVKSIGMLYMKYFMFIEAIYIILQLVYYLFAKWIYEKQINSWI